MEITVLWEWKGILEGSYLQDAVFPDSLRMSFTSVSVRGLVVYRVRRRAAARGIVDIDVIGSTSIDTGTELVRSMRSLAFCRSRSVL